MEINEHIDTQQKPVKSDSVTSRSVSAKSIKFPCALTRPPHLGMPRYTSAEDAYQKSFDDATRKGFINEHNRRVGNRNIDYMSTLARPPSNPSIIPFLSIPTTKSAESSKSDSSSDATETNNSSDAAKKEEEDRLSSPIDISPRKSSIFGAIKQTFRKSVTEVPLFSKDDTIMDAEEENLSPSALIEYLIRGHDVVIFSYSYDEETRKIKKLFKDFRKDGGKLDVCERYMDTTENGKEILRLCRKREKFMGEYKSVPTIYIKDRAIFGLRDFNVLRRSGELRKLMEAAIIKE